MLEQPLGTFYDSSAADGNEESIIVSSPDSGDWFIKVEGFLAFSGVSASGFGFDAIKR